MEKRLKFKKEFTEYLLSRENIQCYPVDESNTSNDDSIARETKIGNTFTVRQDKETPALIKAATSREDPTAKKKGEVHSTLVVDERQSPLKYVRTDKPIISKGKRLTVAERNEKFHRLNAVNEMSANGNVCAVKDSTKLYHERTGHICRSTFQHTENLLYDMRINSNESYWETW
ncbi:hypothetical protein JTB14_018072 [Gonioctena quinquepunctata]|nr:hypothetical protein JTB14_018072 [Gonioctena quinquepunctata]